ncbi:hypothetical protein EYF80_051150 [Liparis tanakae]|uniref:Uncharacterized protein n=1 Tax=Liparis tanakae TaxID=230148 RepID=A0A4Z2FCQ9_9TELE|nr:hypothetical protein EYF80_051150 [Liparis tanakae]
MITERSKRSPVTRSPAQRVTAEGPGLTEQLRGRTSAVTYRRAARAVARASQAAGPRETCGAI